MTAISETTGTHRPQQGLWRRTTQVLGKMWAKVIALPKAHSAAAGQNALPPEYFRFPPY